MNLYKLTQDFNQGYDTYDSAVVAAESEEEAKHIHVGDAAFEWAPPDRIKVEFLGTAKDNTEVGIILESYNAQSG